MSWPEPVVLMLFVFVLFTKISSWWCLVQNYPISLDSEVSIEMYKNYLAQIICNPLPIFYLGSCKYCPGNRDNILAVMEENIIDEVVYKQCESVDIGLPLKQFAVHLMILSTHFVKTGYVTLPFFHCNRIVQILQELQVYLAI